MIRKDATQEHMARTLFKIGERIIDACDKVHVVLNEHDEKMMTDNIAAMETIMTQSRMGGGVGNGSGSGTSGGFRDMSVE